MKPVIAIALIVLAASCQPVNHRAKGSSGENKLNQLKWMIGKWQMQTPGGTITEEWQQPSDTEWHAVSYMVSAAGDTSFAEHIRLNITGNQLMYLPAVSDQNGGSEVSFAEKSFSDSLVVFENLNHDFPQRIIYKRISDTAILAAIEGRQNGQDRREEFAYTRK